MNRIKRFINGVLDLTVREVLIITFFIAFTIGMGNYIYHTMRYRFPTVVKTAAFWAIFITVVMLINWYVERHKVKKD